MSNVENTSVETRNPETGEVICCRRCWADRSACRPVAGGVPGLAGHADRRRAGVLCHFSATLGAKTEHLARLIKAEVGKTISEAGAEVKRCANLVAWFAERAPAMLAD